MAYKFSERYEVIGFGIAEWHIDELRSDVDYTLALNQYQVKEPIGNGITFTNVWKR